MPKKKSSDIKWFSIQVELNGYRLNLKFRNKEEFSRYILYYGTSGWIIGRSDSPILGTGETIAIISGWKSGNKNIQKNASLVLVMNMIGAFERSDEFRLNWQRYLELAEKLGEAIYKGKSLC